MPNPQSVRDIFEKAAEIPAAERERFLDQACQENKELRTEVERLLASYEKWDHIFDTVHTDQPHQAPSPIPAFVGPYRILRELGHGGVGAVYLAIRADESFKKHVAIKLLRPGLQSDEIVRRFRYERQILASIDHPFIAKLLDGGSTAEGMPYLVMEYVDGKPIDEYCESHRLTIDQRLQLFINVCSAVHFAHQHLVVHRDLKPGNLLVLPDGTPRLLDFGIAKLLDPSLFALTVNLTRADSRMMTPEYASPEQIRGENITTASDIYSLGIMLYEILTGHLPYRIRSRPLHEVARAICDEPPARPSAVVGIAEQLTDGQRHTRLVTADSISHARQTSPDKLRKKLRGDLEHILMMALRKEPPHRYASVEQFGDDIRRYREGLPVRARHGTWTYRASRFVSRHKVGLGAVALVILSLIGISAIATRERMRAERESTKANAVIEFLTTSLGAIDPRVAQGQEPTVRHLLDEAERRLADSQTLPYAEEAAIRAVIAESRFQLGQLRQARDQFATLLRTSRANLGDDHPDTVAALTGLASAQADLGELKDAEQNARLALQRSEQLRNHDRLALQASNTLANVLLRLGTREHLTDAERVLDRALAIPVGTFNNGDADRLTAEQLKAQLRLTQNLPLEAEPLARQTYGAALTRLGPRHPTTLAALDVLANCLFELSRYAELVKAQESHANDTRKVLGDDHVMTLRAEHNVAETLRLLDRLDESQQAFARVLQKKTRVLGENHPSTLLTRHAVALLYKDLKQPTKAEELLREVARVRRDVLGPDHSDTLDSEMMIALTLYEQGRQRESRDAYAEVLAKIRTALGETSGAYLVGTVNYAGLLYRLGDYRAAEETLRTSLTAHRRAYGDTYYGTYYTMTELGTTLVHLEQFTEAEQLLLGALQGFRTIYTDNPNHNRVRQTLERLEKLYLAWNKPERAAESRGQLDKMNAAGAKPAS
jgi:serine/threonine-protein kinase